MPAGHVADNPWPNPGTQPEAQPKRNNFPKVQNRVGRSNAAKKTNLPAKNIEAQQGSIVKRCHERISSY